VLAEVREAVAHCETETVAEREPPEDADEPPLALGLPENEPLDDAVRDAHVAVPVAEGQKDGVKLSVTVSDCVSE